MKGISKSFLGLKVLNAVDFDLMSGEVHVVLGENGAGKSTLVKILSGAYSLDSGEIEIDGRKIDPRTFGPKEASRRGVTTIYQNFHLVPHLSVAENISLADFALGPGLVNWPSVEKKAREVLENIGFSVDVHAKVQTLTVSQKQRLEIAMAVSRNSRVLIMDEPTASLSKPEIETLFSLIMRIKKKGIGIVYISHKMEEIKQIGDRVTVLRDGAKVATIPIQDVNLETIIRMMTGKEPASRRQGAGQGSTRTR